MIHYTRYAEALYKHYTSTEPVPKGSPELLFLETVQAKNEIPQLIFLHEKMASSRIEKKVPYPKAHKIPSERKNKKWSHDYWIGTEVMQLPAITGHKFTPIIFDGYPKLLFAIKNN